jgi:type I pantothenate kinase
MADLYAALADEVSSRAAPGRPVLVGIAGAVGVGKTTTAALLRDLLAGRGRSVEVLTTDDVLLPNAELERLGLTMQKGFPGTFDDDALEAALGSLRAGVPVELPVYSHETYDRVPGARRTVEAAEVVLVEGVNALQPPAVDLLDVAVYVDASEEDVEAWFVERFLALCAAATEDETSFYRGFAAMPVDQQRTVAEWTWREINLVNLREHIAPSRARATVVLTKSRDHSLQG